MDINLKKISETSTKLVLGHEPVPNAIGFRTSPVVKNGQIQEGKWAHTWDGNRTQHSFAPGFPPYRVEALSTLASGEWNGQDPVPVTWWESVQKQLPTFNVLRLVPVSNESALRSAISNIRPGDKIYAISPFVVSSTLSIQTKLPSPALIDKTNIRVNGGDTGGVVLNTAENIWLYGGTVTSSRKGIYFKDTIGCKWYDFVIKDCGDTGLFVTSIDRDNIGVDIQGEITNCGLRYQSTNPLIDPHTEKGTGVHGAYVGARFTQLFWTRDSSIVLDVHDQPTGAAAQIGGTITNSFIAVRAKNITFNAQQQVAGSGIQVWGEANNLEMQVEATDLAGRAVDTNGLYGSASNIRVTYGRAVRCCKNPKLAGQSPYQPHNGVKYTNCQ